MSGYRHGVADPQEFDWEIIEGPDVVRTALFIFFAGILASAAGIGGGGIFVAVLMFSQHLEVHRAIPLSKAIIFGGAVQVAIRNYLSEKSRQNVNTKIICYMVPMALAGTVFGVLFNIALPPLVLLLGLGSLLSFMAYTTMKKGIKEWKKASQNRNQNARVVPSEGDVQPISLAGTGYEDARRRSTPVPSEDDPIGGFRARSSQQGRQSTLELPPDEEAFTQHEARVVWCALTGLLCIVIYCGKKTHDDGVVGMTKTMWIGIPSVISVLLTVAFHNHLSTNTYVAASTEMGAVGTHIPDPMGGRVRLRRDSNNGPSGGKGEAVKYAVVATFAGICSGLFGIGGGLVFSPFLLHMNVDPQVAVTTSATIVIFTSTSTTLQYLLLHRIIVPLAVVYGITAFLASILGSKLILYIKDTAGGRGASITMLIVGAAVTLSAVLSIVKGIQETGR